MARAIRNILSLIFNLLLSHYHYFCVFYFSSLLLLLTVFLNEKLIITKILYLQTIKVVQFIQQGVENIFFVFVFYALIDNNSNRL